MDYESLANDIHSYMSRVGLEKTQVTLIGHSLGAKTAMAFTCLYPELVDSLVSLDASPIDRTDYPHLNVSSQRMIDTAVSIGDLTGMPL